MICRATDDDLLEQRLQEIDVALGLLSHSALTLESRFALRIRLMDERAVLDLLLSRSGGHCRAA
jgi:hypothetical protein